MKRGSIRKRVFPWISSSELSVSPDWEWFGYLTSPTGYFHISVFIFSSHPFPRSVRHGAEYQLWLNSPWFNSPQALCGPKRLPSGQVVCWLCPLSENISSTLPALPLPPCCHIPLPSSPSFADKKVWRLEPRGGKEEEEDQSCLFPLILPLKSRHSTNISIFQPCKWVRCCCNCHKKASMCFDTQEIEAIRKISPLLFGGMEGKVTIWQEALSSYLVLGRYNMKNTICLSLMTLQVLWKYVHPDNIWYFSILSYFPRKYLQNHSTSLFLLVSSPPPFYNARSSCCCLGNITE